MDFLRSRQHYLSFVNDPLGKCKLHLETGPCQGIKNPGGTQVSDHVLS